MHNREIIRQRVLFGDTSSTLRFVRVMAGEYRCDVDHGTYYVWSTTRTITRRGWQREEYCWRMQYNREIAKDFATLTEAKIAANLHHAEKE